MKNLSAVSENEDIATKEYVDTNLADKQDTLVSKVNIKSINYVDLTDSGNFNIFNDLIASTGILFKKDFEWTKSVSKGMGNGWYGIAYSGNEIVALTSSGKVSISTDGINWSTVTTVSNLGSNNYHALTYGNNKYVALSFTGHISTSTDGTSWTTATVNSNLGSKNWQNISYGNGTFVALGANGYSSTSSDGTTWAVATYKSAMGQHSYYGIAYGNNKFVVVGNTGYVTTSTDGSTWTTATQVENLGSNNWIDVVFAEGKFYAIGSTGYTSTSTDGVNWTPAVLSNNLGTHTWRRTCYNGNTIIALSSYSDMSYGKPIYSISTKVEDEFNNAGYHNSVYRGRDITTLFYNGTLSTQIAAGTFNDIYIGDYIIGSVSGRKYIVAAINYRLHKGDTECTTNHVLMIPEKLMGTAKMNSSSTATGAYYGSQMYSTNLTTFKDIIVSDFGNAHILQHRNYFANKINSTYGHETAGAWYDSTIDLMNENMVIGGKCYHNLGYPGYTNNMECNTHIVDNSQLALFRFRPDLINAFNDNNERTNYWLRDVANMPIAFCAISRYGNTVPGSANGDFGVRPAFLIY